jgi:hypothetical protein
MGRHRSTFRSVPCREELSRRRPDRTTGVRHRSLSAVLLLVGALWVPAAGAATQSYYVGCDGHDGSSGHSPATAWRSLTRSNRAPLRPGDALLLQRGCAWTGQRLDVTWRGTPSARIRVGAYGDPHLPRPLITDGDHENVLVTGSYLQVSSLDVRHDPPPRTSCGQPVGYLVGFSFIGARHVTLTRSRARHELAGAKISETATQIKLLRNTFVENDVMQTMARGKELGAWGVLVNGDHNVIAHNHLGHNRSVCRISNGRYASNSVELYGASHNRIHHNWSS